jgi:hypothetical protein
VTSLTGLVVFGGEGRGAAQRYFRAELPAQALRRRGWDAKVGNFVLSPKTPTEIAADPRLRGWDGMRGQRPGPIMTPEIITIRLMDNVDPLDLEHYPEHNTMPEEIERARQAGQIVCYDLDDDIWGIPDWSPAKRAMNSFNPKVRAYDLKMLNENLEVVDAVICSTPHIAERVRAQVPSANPVVVRNGIDVGRYVWPRRVHEGPLRVGWMGSVSHAAPHLRTVMRSLDVLTGRAEFIHLGYSPHAHEACYGLYAELPEGLTVGHIDWGPHDELAAKLAHLDVGIIPRVDTDFNEGQSISSGLQYAAAGIVYIAFPSEEYRRAYDRGVGLLARSPDEWRSTLSALVDASPLELAAAGQRQRQLVHELYGIDVVGRSYESLFQCLMGTR